MRLHPHAHQQEQQERAIHEPSPVFNEAAWLQVWVPIRPLTGGNLRRVSKREACLQH